MDAAACAHSCNESLLNDCAPMNIKYKFKNKKHGTESANWYEKGIGIVWRGQAIINIYWFNLDRINLNFTYFLNTHHKRLERFIALDTLHLILIIFIINISFA